ncbi:MAG: aldehyde dehydrogenase family protein, partial [Ornithinimicrobium sp.]
MAELFIAGQWRSAQAGGTRRITCPADGAHVATVAEGAADDAQRAVSAAREAFDHGAWRSSTAPE